MKIVKVVVVIAELCVASSLVLSAMAEGANLKTKFGPVAENDDSSTLPTVTVVDSDGNASESGANTGRFRVSRTGDSGSALTVHYALSGSTANGADYATLPGSVTISAGSSSATIIIDTIDDSIVEGDENVVLTLAPDAAYVIGSPSGATVDMEDDDRVPPPATLTVTVVARDANASEDGLDSAVFTVTRTGDTTSALTVTYSLGGSADNGSDYSSLSGSVTIEAGSSSANVTVDPIDDAIVEGDETVVLALSADPAYTVGSPKSAQVAIADNDDSSTGPTVTVVDSDGNASESGANAGRFRVTRTGNTGAALTVHYSLSGSAANGADYATLPGSVTIPAGSSSATIVIDTIDDSIVEGDENVVLSLSPDAAYDIRSPSSATVDMEDNDSLASGSSALVQLRVASQTDDKITMLSWDSETGRRYQLQYKSDWNAANWTDVGNIITATNGTTIAPQAMNPDQQRFYRLVLLP